MWITPVKRERVEGVGEWPGGVVNAAASFSGPKSQGHICTSRLFYFYLCFIRLGASESLGKSTDPESSISLHQF